MSGMSSLGGSVPSHIPPSIEEIESGATLPAEPEAAPAPPPVAAPTADATGRRSGAFRLLDRGLSEAEKDRVLVALRQFLVLRGIEFEEDVSLGSARVPLIVQLPNSRVCIDVHHSLIDPVAQESPVVAAARSQFLEALSLDAFDLLHDLPAAVARLKLPSGAVG